MPGNKTKSGNILKLPDQKAIEQQAAEWLMRFDDGDGSTEEWESFRAWYVKNEQHRATLQRLYELWGALDVLEELNDYAASDSNAMFLEQDRSPWRRLKPGQITVRAIAASLAIFFVVAIYQGMLFKGAGFTGDFQTLVGEQQTLSLPDGSIIVLNTNSAIRVDFAPGDRNIRLLRGEVFFEVAKDKSRPFRVRTEKGVVTAVGTAFTVSLNKQKLDVVVTEGRVALSQKPLTGVPPETTVETSAESIIEITAGQSVTFDRKVERIEHFASEALDRKLSWRQGVLAFNGESLAEVIEDIGRYSDVEIEVVGDNLKQLPIAGYIKVGEVKSMLNALKVMSGVEITKVDENNLRIYLPARKQG